jgi:hypothetical protein
MGLGSIRACRSVTAAQGGEVNPYPTFLTHDAFALGKPVFPVGWPEGVSPSGSHRVKWAAGEVPAVRVLFCRPLPEPAERVSP